LNDLKDITVSNQKNITLNQESIDQTNQKLESALNQITVHETKVEESNTQLLNNLSAASVDNANSETVNNNNATDVNVNDNNFKLNEGGGVISDKQSQFEKVENFTIVKETAEKQQSDSQKMVEKTNETLQKLQENVTNTSKTASSATATNNNTVEKQDEESKIDLSSLEGYLSYLTEQQNDMIGLLQELVDGQNQKRWSESPIKN